MEKIEVSEDGCFDRNNSKLDMKKHKKKRKDPECNSSGVCSIETVAKSKKRKKMEKDKFIQRGPYSEGNLERIDLHNDKFQDCDHNRMNLNFNKKKHKRKKDPEVNCAAFSSKESLDQENISTRSKGLANGSKNNDGMAMKLKNSLPEGTEKKVRFANDVEVFPIDDRTKLPKESSEDSLVRGKRFTKEENEMIKEAVNKYIEDHDLGTDGLQKIFSSTKCHETRGCWNEIAASIPWRPKIAVYKRATILLQGGGDIMHKWTPEEFEIIQRHYDSNGPKWKDLVSTFGRHRIHIKDAWRRNKLPNKKKGRWSPEEYKMLYDLVNLDLRMKAFEAKNSKHGMLRDNICWSAISDKISTRNIATCCTKWYHSLSSSMVAQGSWSDCDDYLLVDALRDLDACCIEDVDWEHLLEHRSGEVCLKRWNEMGKQLDGYREKSFMEQVDVLSNRYCIEMLEYKNRNDDDNHHDDEEE